MAGVGRATSRAPAARVNGSPVKPDPLAGGRARPPKFDPLSHYFHFIFFIFFILVFDDFQMVFVWFFIRFQDIFLNLNFKKLEFKFYFIFILFILFYFYFDLMHGQFIRDCTCKKMPTHIKTNPVLHRRQFMARGRYHGVRHFLPYLFLFIYFLFVIYLVLCLLCTF